ncbi:hypothetical protein [Rubricoccus marinus]|uniref:Peptidase M14 carboxypeptidase A domain-containing protein n=1 Tax=Rubricoccus marinus TaxID=716817 RepID=A0A259TVA1_9BACT|nr:hypothetical protein [Rubricoccus marinus]OZC01626.1 hypothetical protein BSZ36_00690 [Rubricoccus marinus]
MRALPLLLVFAVAPACAQTDKPSASGDPSDRRADTLVVSPEAKPGTEVSVPVGPGTTSVGYWDVNAGETPVRIARREAFGREGTPEAIHMLNLHDDESTSVDAALDVTRETGGWVVELQHSGDRNLAFTVGGERFAADPNRMFTDAGRAKTLASLSRATPEAEAALETFAASVLKAYTDLDPAVVVTLHNNTEDNYSVASYASGGAYEADAEAVTLHPGTDPDDFFFVTDRALYDALVARGFNAVLQDNARATDDGSLSVWAAQNGRPYVNVEAQHGHREEQARMIRALVEVIAAR